MLECREYTIKELSAYIHTKGVDATKTKLQNYGVDFEMSGRGKNTTFSIKAVNNPFKVFTVFDLGAAPQTDIKKFAYFVFEVLCNDEFNGMGAEMMEEYLRNTSHPISRQTISKYLKKLSKGNFIIQSTTDFVYYRVYKRYGVQTHEVITKEEYSAAWKHYWMLRNEMGYDSAPAFKSMYNKFGGAPRKFGLLEQCAFYNDVYDWLIEILLKEVGDIE